jgi:3-oxoacyl-[acyl-carrier protein] reductase
MNLALENKNFLVAGSSRGIGYYIAAQLLNEGACVVITGRDEKIVEQAYQGFEKLYPKKVLRCAGDLGDNGIIKKISELIVNEWGQLNGVVANFGAVKQVPDWDIEMEDWNWYMNANFLAPVNLVRAFIPFLKKTQGSIIITGSIAGVEEIGAPLPYSAAKAAIIMYAKGLSKKLASDNIRVNVIAPGNVIFPGGNWDKKVKIDPQAVSAMLDAKVPLKRFGTPEEIASLAAFLLSDQSSFITGSCIVVDGGQTAKFN